jgi:hypothetical protein
MRAHRQAIRGFSLLEVVIAVGVFAGAVSVMLGLLPFLARQAGTTADSMTATQLPDAIRLELQRVGSTGGFEALAGQCSPLGVPLPATFTLVADRSAQRVQTLDYLPPAGGERISPAARYFVIEVWRHDTEPLVFAPGTHLLALQVRVSWPYHLPGTTAATMLADREQITFNLALYR